LNEVYDPERDVEALKKGGGRGLIYADTIGLVDPSKISTPKVHFGEENAGDSDGNESEEDQESNDEGDDNDGKNGFEDRTPRGHRHEDKEAKKVCSHI
jgi:RIO kinase 1